MTRLFCIRTWLSWAAVILLVGCSPPVAQNQHGTEKHTFSWRQRVNEILQPGWEVVETNGSVVVSRKEPVTFYHATSLPLLGPSRTQMIEQSRYTEPYQVTLDIVERLPDEKYEELKNVNARTERELEAYEDRMRSFMGKGDYTPKTSEDRALYEEYKKSLKDLLYRRLPDLYDEKYSVYITTTRHPSSAFYFTREELECRAVLENIYSFAEMYGGNESLADVYEGDESTTWSPGASHDKVAVFETFQS